MTKKKTARPIGFRKKVRHPMATPRRCRAASHNAHNRMPKRSAYNGSNIYNYGSITKYVHNKSFLGEIVSGNYFYFDGRIWLYHSDVFDFSNGKVSISQKARDNKNLYCLAGVKHRLEPLEFYYSSIERVCFYTDYTFALLDKTIDYKSKDYSNTLKSIIKYVNGGDGKGGDDGGHFPNSFQEYFRKIMKERNFTIKQLSDATNIPEKTINRMRTLEGYEPSKEYIIICCVVMKLYPWESDMLLYLAGHQLRRNVIKDKIYIACIHVLYIEGSIELCDEVLSKCGFQTFSMYLQSNKNSKKYAEK